MSNLIVCGAGNFISGHLLKKFMDRHNVVIMTLNLLNIVLFLKIKCN